MSVSTKSLHAANDEAFFFGSDNFDSANDDAISAAKAKQVGEKTFVFEVYLSHFCFCLLK